MNRSIIDRIFPPSSSPPQLRYEEKELLARQSSRSPASPPHIRMHDFVPLRASRALNRDVPTHTGSSASPSSRKKATDLQVAPLSASVLHHDDPFLPIERATKAVQDTIQLLLDIQSRALTGRMNGEEQDSVTSGSSVTPTQSIITPRSSSGVRTVPIRQPIKRKMGLRSARKGILRQMHRFAELKQEELWIIEAQAKGRTSALEHVTELETKRESCKTEIESIRQGNTNGTISTLRAEAQGVSSEIEELEHKMLELRVRHRHLLNQADQLESSLESNISSFRGTIALIDQETRDFLQRPPVPHALADGEGMHGLGMYALKPERRTLEMAKEQWTLEKEVLQTRQSDIENERMALLEGQRIWSEAVDRIDHFEQSLRQQTAALTNNTNAPDTDSMDLVLNELDEVIETLESDLAVAESKNWNLLICAVGAELEAFHQAREMLSQTQLLANGSNGHHPSFEPPTDATQAGQREHRLHSKSPSASVTSNQSLIDTMQDFSHQSVSVAPHADKIVTKYESEDDEPPSDFLLSR